MQWAGPSRGQPSREEHVGCFQVLFTCIARDLNQRFALQSHCFPMYLRIMRNAALCGTQWLGPNAARGQGVMASAQDLNCLTPCLPCTALNASEQDLPPYDLMSQTRTCGTVVAQIEVGRSRSQHSPAVPIAGLPAAMANVSITKSSRRREVRMCTGHKLREKALLHYSARQCQWCDMV